MISIIVPVYKDEKALYRFIQESKKLEGNFELIYCITHDEKYLAKKYPNLRFVVSAKGRAIQMNKGASCAGGSVFLFLHVDSILEKGIVQAVEEGIKTSPIGCLSMYFDSKEPLMILGGFLARMRVRVWNIAFGDQGIFITRELFESVGGYKEIPIMEDYALSLEMKRRNIKIHTIPSKIITRPVRFTKNGMMKTMFAMKRWRYMYRKGIDPELINKEYGDIR